MVPSRILLRPKILSLRLFLSSCPATDNPSSCVPAVHRDIPHHGFPLSKRDGQPWVPGRPVRDVATNASATIHVFFIIFQSFQLDETYWRAWKFAEISTKNLRRKINFELILELLILIRCDAHVCWNMNRKLKYCKYTSRFFFLGKNIFCWKYLRVIDNCVNVKAF